VESLTFGSEFIALKQAIDLMEVLHYKLRMMGIPFDDSTTIYCNNEVVVKNTTVPESTLKKKHNAICYNRACEALAAGHICVCKILGTDNPAAKLKVHIIPNAITCPLVKRISPTALSAGPSKPNFHLLEHGLQSVKERACTPSDWVFNQNSGFG
jgi:hypothetical protein